MYSAFPIRHSGARVYLVLIAVSILSNNCCFGWSKTGHDAIAYIAECNMTKNAQKNVEKYLDGKSIVYYASWMDDYRNTPEYGHTTHWHGTSVNDQMYCQTDKNDDGIVEIEKAVALLKNYKNLDDSTVAVNIKYLVHLVGDVHCPVHIGYPNLKKNFDIVLYGKNYAYHKVWDELVNDLNHKWYYTEWQHQLDRCSYKEKKRIEAGSPRDWAHDNAVFCRQIYDMVKPGGSYGKDFMNAAHPIAEHQILYAGYRLAKILNDIFG